MVLVMVPAIIEYATLGLLEGVVVGVHGLVLVRYWVLGQQVRTGWCGTVVSECLCMVKQPRTSGVWMCVGVVV